MAKVTLYGPDNDNQLILEEAAAPSFMTNIPGAPTEVALQFRGMNHVLSFDLSEDDVRLLKVWAHYAKLWTDYKGGNG